MDLFLKTSCNTQAITGKKNKNYEMLTRANIIFFEMPTPYSKVPSNYTTKIHLVLNDSKSPSESENPKCGADLGLLLGPLFLECPSHQFYFMLTSQHHINDWINFLLTLKF
jgi:hypothetical protein